MHFDNYFTTPNLLECLYEKGIYAARTIHTNRNASQKEFCQFTNKMNRDEFQYLTSGNLVLHKWKDRKLVLVLLNFTIRLPMILFNEKEEMVVKQM